VASTLHIPLFLAAVGIIFRGATFATRGAAGTARASPVIGALFVLSSILTPFFLGAAVGGIASGRVPVGNASGDAVTSWWNPTSVLVGCLAVATGAYLAAVYLAADARRLGDEDLAEAFRARALIAGLVTGAVALGGIAVLREDARPLYDDLLSGGGLGLVIVSAAAGVATLALVWRQRYGLARVSAALAVAAVIGGWAVAQSPDLLPGAITIEDAAAPHATLVAVVVSLCFGALVLVPSLALLFRLVLRGRLDKELPPLGEGPLP
jgi:cytochrome d ubiquinol oxidase subunit II